MAAILCKGIGDIINGTCKCIGEVCSLPCKLCQPLCTACGKCCDGAVQALMSPFCMFIVVTLAFNVPPIMIGVMEVPGLAAGCPASLFLVANAAFCVVHIMAAIYVARTIYYDDDNDGAANRQEHRNRFFPQQRRYNSNSVFDKASHLFCYDPWMAVYLLVLLAYFFVITFSVSVDTDDAACASGTDVKVYTSSICGFCFLFVGAAVLGCSVCCAGLCCPTTTTTTTSHRPPGANTSSTPSSYPASTANVPNNDFPSNDFPNNDFPSNDFPNHHARSSSNANYREQEPPMAYATYAGTAPAASAPPSYDAPPPPPRNPNYKTSPPADDYMEQGYASSSNTRNQSQANNKTSADHIEDIVNNVAKQGMAAIGNIWQQINKKNTSSTNGNNTNRT